MALCDVFDIVGGFFFHTVIRLRLCNIIVIVIGILLIRMQLELVRRSHLAHYISLIAHTHLQWVSVKLQHFR